MFYIIINARIHLIEYEMCHNIAHITLNENSIFFFYVVQITTEIVCKN